MYSHPREDRIWEFLKRRKTGISLIKHPDSIYFRMTIRYVMCFTVHYLKKKKLSRKKTQTGSPKQPISPEGRLWRGSPGLIVEFSAYLAAMLPCFLMSSHVIPCYPKMAKRRKYGN
jgi:hypothetical protein